MFLALDPGETTGWASFNQDGSLIDYGQAEGFDFFSGWLEFLEPKPFLIICEEWILNPNIPQGGSRQETVQVIGSVRNYAIRNGIDIEWQSPSRKPAGYAWAGMKPLPKSQHSISHQYDAIAHGTYYLVKHKIIPTALERKLNRQRLNRIHKGLI